MLDFFTFSVFEILNSLRFIFVVLFFISVILLTIIATYITTRAVSYGMFLLRIKSKVTVKRIPEFIAHCFKVAWNNWGARKYNGGNDYWSGIRHWRYYDKSKGKYVLGKHGESVEDEYTRNGWFDDEELD